MRLRSEVFVVEQQCAYLDADGKDEASYHLCGRVNGTLAAYARILPPGLSYAEASIGRVVTGLAFRKHGFGRELMQKAIELTTATYTTDTIRIGAQLYLLEFYKSFEFKPVGEMYLEDDIPHVEMLRTK